MFKLIVVILAYFALAHAQVRVTRLFGPDSQCRSNFALGAVVATIPNCIPSNCTASVQPGFYEIVECAQTLAAASVPPYWVTVSAYGANDTCNSNSRTTIIGARSGQCFPALSGFVSFSCTSGQVTSRYCASSCEDDNCVNSEVNTQCEQSNLLGGIFADSQCPTQPEPPMAPIAIDSNPSPVDTPSSGNDPSPNTNIPINSPVSGPGSEETTSGSIRSAEIVAIQVFLFAICVLIAF